MDALFVFKHFVDSLKATIHKIRPDVIPADKVPVGAVPIGANRQEKTLDMTSSSYFMLPAKWNSSVEPAGWYDHKFTAYM